MDRLIKCGRELGLEGKELHQFIEAQKIIERGERAESRRVELAKLEFKVAMEKEKKEILEKERLKIQAVLELKNEGVDMSMNFRSIEGRQRAKGPKLPTFVDWKDDLDSYLKRFEWFAMSNGWERHEWATALSAHTNTERVVDQRSTRRKSQDELSVCCRVEREVRSKPKDCKRIIREFTSTLQEVL